MSENAELPPQPTGRRRPGHRAKGRHRRLKIAGAIVLAFVLVLGSSVTYLYLRLNGNLNTVDIDGDVIGDRPDKVDDGPKGPLNILVMGSDTRDCDGCAIDHEDGDGGSDTTILLHLSADRKTAYGVSIPRDTLVDRPACKDKDKPSVVHPAAKSVMWNEAYSLGGEACTRTQFEHATGIFVDHYITVNFASFKNMVDAIGGVEVCVPEDIHSEGYGISIKKGTRKISGNAALAYVRVRHGVGDGSDLGRVKRQQAFIAAMVGKALSANTLANPIRTTRFLDAATKSLTLDMNLTDLVKLALQFKDVGGSGIEFITVPYATAPSDRARVVFAPEAAELWQQILNDQPLSEDLRTGAIQVDHLPGQPAPPPTTESPSAGGTPASPQTSAPPVDMRTDADNRELESVGLCT